MERRHALRAPDLTLEGVSVLHDDPGTRGLALLGRLAA